MPGGHFLRPFRVTLGSTPSTTSTTQAPTTTTTAAPTTTTTQGPQTPPGLYVDPDSIPAPVAGESQVRIVQSGFTGNPTPGDPNGAQFRTTCRTSHYLYDDPILYPGAGSSHLHTFFGNTSSRAGVTDMNSGNSTCAGGTANLSSYWVPTMIDTSDNSVVPGWRTMDFEAYYKSGYQGVQAQDVVDFPAGLRMIAGDMSRTYPDQWGPVEYVCRNGGQSSQSIPNCAVGDIMTMVVRFPQCWDGVNLDSPDHKSHMAYGAGWPDLGCPSSHPVALTEITFNVYYQVPPGGTSNWRLSSDTYDGPAGYSGHGDWWNGWTVFDTVVESCFEPYPGLDCGQNQLGDGTELYWVWQ